MSSKARIAIALACAVLAVVASQAYAQEARRKEAQLRQETLDRYGGETVQLVVAAHRLEAGATITERDVALKEWVSELAPEGALMELDQAVGSTLTSNIAAGQVLTDLSIGSSDSSLEIPAGMVAVSFALTDKLGLVSGVDVGSRVFAYRVDEDGTQLVSGKVTVVSIHAEGGALSSSKTVTVAARPDDIPALLEAAAQGTLRLVLPATNVTEASAGVVSAPSVVEPENGSEGLLDGFEDAAETEDDESDSAGDGADEADVKADAPEETDHPAETMGETAPKAKRTTEGAAEGTTQSDESPELTEGNDDGH